jgi:hypothetical protein
MSDAIARVTVYKHVPTFIQRINKVGYSFKDTNMGTDAPVTHSRLSKKQ